MALWRASMNLASWCFGRQQQLLDISITNKRESGIVAWPQPLMLTTYAARRKRSITGDLRSSLLCCALFICSCSRWIRTGDEVKINENAEMWIIDRLKVLSIHEVMAAGPVAEMSTL